MGWINSCELFLKNKKIRFISSEGLDFSYDVFHNELEYITTWKTNEDEIECNIPRASSELFFILGNPEGPDGSLNRQVAFLRTQENDKMAANYHSFPALHDARKHRFSSQAEIFVTVKGS